MDTQDKQLYITHIHYRTTQSHFRGTATSHIAVRRYCYTVVTAREGFVQSAVPALPRCSCTATGSCSRPDVVEERGMERLTR